MKYKYQMIHILFLLIVFFLSPASFKKFAAFKKICTTTNSQGKKSKIPNTGIMNLIELLFDEPRRFILTPEGKDADKKDEKEIDEEKWKNGVNIYIPRSKYNPYENVKIGEDGSAYFFDFLDPLLQFEISWEFQMIYIKTSHLPYNVDDDPYSFEKLEDYELHDIIQRIKTYGKEKWEKNISVPQIKIMIDKWGWIINTYRSNKAKYFVDKYDFNGDGRLNPREFILGMILENRNNLDGKYSCKYCMEDVINNKIDIIFKYISYNRFMYITAEEIWGGFKHLKRGSNSNFYSLYACQYYRNLRTFAVNDFILKSQDSHPAQIILREFRTGILLGYWNRQSDIHKIFLADEKNDKLKRWTDQGFDIKCDEYKNRYKRDI
jgi:hypothetical protein